MAHRLAWTDANGPIPPGMHVLHHCDVSACVELTHLYLGTDADNARDRAERGRGYRPPTGEDNPQARLTWPMVFQVRAEYAAGDSQRVIAERHGVAQMTVSKIVRRETWRET